MLSKKRKILMAFFLIFALTAVIPMDTNFLNNTVTELAEDPEIEDLGHRPTYVTVPVTVNKVEGTPLTEEQVKANIKKMNEIYNCEVVIFTWDGTINEIPDPSKPGGTADGGTAAYGDRTTARNRAEQNAGSKGVSITVSTDLGPNTNGRAIVGQSHSTMVKNGTDGSTWAHEIQHAMGQSHGEESQADEDMDGDGDVDGDDTGWDANGDGRITPEDKKYNLWGRKSDREGDEINCEVIYGNATLIEGAVNKTRDNSSVLIPGITKRGGGINDTRSDVKNETSGVTVPDVKHVDIIRGGITVDWLWAWFKFWLEIAFAPFVNCTYTIAIDNLPELGVPYTNTYYGGADIIIEFSFMQGLEGLTLISQWNDTELWFEEILPPIPFEIDELREEVDFDNSTGSGWVESFFDVMLSVEFESPELAAILGEVPFDMWAIAQQFDPLQQLELVDNSSKRLTDLANTPVQAIAVSSDDVTAGDIILVTGMEFAGNSEVTLFIDGTEITTVPTDMFGEFAVNITVPVNMPTVNNSILMVRDLEGDCDAIYMDVTGISGGGGIPGFEFLVAVIGLVSVVIAFLKKKDIFI